MHYFITGGAGFVGTRLIKTLLEDGMRVTAVDIAAQHPTLQHPDFTYIAADTTASGDWQKAAATADVIVNFAGRSIFRYWTKAYKKSIYDSRILTTKHLVDAISPNQAPLLISTSAIGYYGDGGNQALTEEAHSGEDFLARVCVDWEDAANAATEKGARVVTMRFGIVLGDTGGALGKMIPAYRMFAGGPLGSGNQWMPWIHVDDIIAAIRFFAGRPESRGAYNLVGPEPATNATFSRTLAKRLHRPDVFTTPSFVLKIVMGEFGGVMLASQKGIPKRLTDEGFPFRYPALAAAIDASVTACGY